MRVGKVILENMIAREYRFHGHGSLAYVYRKGRTVRAAACAMRYAPNSRRQSMRVAVVVAKKVSKSAVVRNRIRRRIYEQVRAAAPLTLPYDVVVTAYDERLASMLEKDIKNTVTQLLQVFGSADRQDRGLVDKSAKD